MKKLRLSVVAFALSAALLIAGCHQQSEIAALATVVSTSLGQLATIDTKNAAVYTKASTVMASVSTDIANWQPGSPVTQQIVTAVNDAVTDLKGIVNVSTQTQELIVLAEGTMESIVAIVGAQSSTTTATPAITAKQYKAKWNAKSPTKLP